MVEVPAGYTNLSDFSRYLILLFEADALFLNDDQHLNGIAAHQEYYDYSYCPIFDGEVKPFYNAQLSCVGIDSTALIDAPSQSPS